MPNDRCTSTYPGDPTIRCFGGRIHYGGHAGSPDGSTAKTVTWPIEGRPQYIDWQYGGLPPHRPSDPEHRDAFCHEEWLDTNRPTQAAKALLAALQEVG